MKGLKIFILNIILLCSMFNTIIVLGATGTTDTLPEVSDTPSTYAPICGTLGDSIYSKTITITVGGFSDDMESINMGLYVDGVFFDLSERVKSGYSASFELPSSGKNYQIRMSTYSSTPGTCRFSTSIK